MAKKKGDPGKLTLTVDDIEVDRDGHLRIKQEKEGELLQFMIDCANNSDQRSDPPKGGKVLMQK